jgi:predicted glycogen debranching enzyme
MQIDDRTEWLEADGLGGFASGTSAGIRTRRYHALLLTAMTPPTDRVVLVNGFDAWVDTPAGSFALSTQRYAPDVLHPDGAAHLTSFTTDPWPTWECEVADGTRVMQEIVVQRAELKTDDRSSGGAISDVQSAAFQAVAAIPFFACGLDVRRLA